MRFRLKTPFVSGSVLLGLLLLPGASAQTSSRMTEQAIQQAAARMAAARAHRTEMIRQREHQAQVHAAVAKHAAPAVSGHTVSSAPHLRTAALGMAGSRAAVGSGSAELTAAPSKASAATPATKAPPLARDMGSIASSLQKGSSTPWAIVVGLTLLTLLPAILLAMTPMVRLLVVFHFLRQALGTQTAPSNQVLMGLALMMTWFLMAPVLTQVEQQATTPYRQGVIDGEEALARGAVPVKAYMLRYAREKDLAVFASAGMSQRPQSREDLPMQVVVPAYMLSELKAGFQIGAVLFLPFLLVDLVIASVTTSVGMLQLPPVVVSTPVKILLFVMVDGWHLLADKLLKSF